MGGCPSCGSQSHHIQSKEIHVLTQHAIIAASYAADHNNSCEDDTVPYHTTWFCKMASTISNIKMRNPLKGLVSKRRRRYVQDGYNLDLTYIRDNLIAMGFPAEKLEGVYRNHIDDVVKFLESKHKDHYKIYNLCSERSYDVSKFQSRVGHYPVDDHNPPQVELIRPFCEDVDEWLRKDPLNVAAVHCKAGKGRTGVMICCYMLHARQFPTADEALNYYGQMRTYDRKGVTIPSQKRYVRYYADLTREELVYRPQTIAITEVRIAPLPYFAQGPNCMQFVISNISRRCIYESPPLDLKRSSQNEHCFIIDKQLRLSGDIKIEFINKPKMKRKEKLFHFWFNTFFVRDVYSPTENETVLLNNDRTPCEKCCDDVMVAEKNASKAAAVKNGDARTYAPHAAERNTRALSYDAQQTIHLTDDQPVRAASFSDLSSVCADARATTHRRDQQQSLVLRLHKSELDNAHKDKQNKLYPAEFTVTLLFQRMPDREDLCCFNNSVSVADERLLQQQTSQLSMPPHTPSESSEADSSESSTADDEGWDSSETTYL